MPIAEPVARTLRSAAWRAALADVLAGDALAPLDAFLTAERERGASVLPSEDEVFAAYEHTRPEEVRVVILGQDPYPTPGHAHGLAFSYRGGGARPRSLANIFGELASDLGVHVPHGASDLTPWARQGVLLLNTVLTVRAGEAGSHRRRGWEVLTDATVRVLAAQDAPIVFLLWGRDARRRARWIGRPHHVLEAGHPSPLSVRHFQGCRSFSRANALLGDRAVDWRL